MLKQAFPPIVNQHSKILLLGTMPGEQSLKLQQYYEHKGNQFWKTIFALFNQPLVHDYEVKKALLLSKGIAVWDVLQYIANAKAVQIAAYKKKCRMILPLFIAITHR